VPQHCESGEGLVRQGEGTAYTVDCQRGAQEGSRCAGQLAPDSATDSGSQSCSAATRVMSTTASTDETARTWRDARRSALTSGDVPMKYNKGRLLALENLEVTQASSLCRAVYDP